MTCSKNKVQQKVLHVLTLSLPGFELSGLSGRWRQAAGGSFLLAVPTGLEVCILAKMGDDGHEIVTSIGGGRRGRRGCEGRKAAHGGEAWVEHSASTSSHLLLLAADRAALLGDFPCH